MKNIYSEKVYLSGDKDVMDTYLRLKESRRLVCIAQRNLYSDAVKEYNRFLLLVRDLMKSFNLNTSLENAIAVSYLIHHGYLSYNKKFDGKEEKDLVKDRLGMNIVRGHGCCRNFSEVGYDVLRLLDFHVKRFYCYLPILCLPNSVGSKQANHVINLIDFDDVKYGIDLYHGCSLYKFKNGLTMEKISMTDNGKIRFKPYYELLTGEGTLESIKKEIEEYALESKKRTISAIAYEDVARPETIAFMGRQKGILEDFHNETNEMKEHIALSLTKKS